MHRKSVEVAQKMIDQPQEFHQLNENKEELNFSQDFKSNSIATLRAKAQEHSEKMSHKLEGAE